MELKTDLPNEIKADCQALMDRLSDIEKGENINYAWLMKQRIFITTQKQVWLKYFFVDRETVVWFVEKYNNTI